MDESRKLLSFFVKILTHFNKWIWEWSLQFMPVNKEKLTVICPVFNEQVTIPLFYGRIQKVFQQICNEFDCDLLFVDNCSTDGSLNIIKEIRKTDSSVYHLGLSRNYGYQKSIECGLKHAKGDLFVIIDVDCEDPPEMIPQFLAKYKEGYQIVYGKRVDRVEASYLKWLRKVFYQLTRYVSDENFNLFMAEFGLMTKEVRDAILMDNNSFPFIRASIGRIGFDSYGIPYKREPRVAGESHYNLVRMTTFAVAGILSSSTFLLRMSAYMFVFWVALMGLLLTLSEAFEVKWAFSLFLFLGFVYCGYSLMAIAIYVARIYKNGLQRPNAIFSRRKTLLQD